MFSNPYGFSGYSPSDEYTRALAEERAARSQYAAALRAQEEARQRAARARLARQAFTPYSPYNSYSSDDYDDLDEGSYTPRSPYDIMGFGMSPQQRRALAQEQRRREQLQLERERILEEERRQKLLEEERQRKLMEEEEERQREAEAQRLRDQEEEFKRIMEERQRAQEARDANEIEDDQEDELPDGLRQFYRDLGLRLPRFEHPDLPHAHARRARTSSPIHRHPAPIHFGSPPPIRTQLRESPSPRMKSPQQPSPSPSQRAESPLKRQATPPKSQAPPPPQATPEETAAAARIQTFYRKHMPHHRVMKTLSDLATQYESLSSAFKLPEKVEYNVDGTHTIVDTASLDLPPVTEEEIPSVPSLTYSAMNVPVHQYDESLNQLLTKLDAVESGGDREIREKRRALARQVEKEAERVERWKVAVWKAHEEQMKVDSQPEPATTSEEPQMESSKDAGESSESEVDESILMTPELPAEKFQSSAKEDDDVPLVDRDWRLLNDFIMF
ncbi:hypothetical protein C8Q75DRAFT_732618 [Abortiporus biennis]|nr:hypothetical protein C8Q75DRAFT_732618 [Abortiporus biennis]